MLKHLNANWTVPSHVHALTTTRLGGVSQPPFDSNNLGLHVGDRANDVEMNRNQLVHQLALPSAPIWLEQTHSTHCILVEEDINRLADAAVTRTPGTVLAIMTADCVPIVLCNAAGDEIAAIHAGWRGLVNGILESTLTVMHSAASDLRAWIGPAICQDCYQTGADVYSTFTQHYPFAQRAFKTHANHWHADLPQLAELILQQLGIPSIHQSRACTYESKNTYYSYRRQAQTGRMATLIWFNQ
jgi:polyphenol oxidase